MEFKVLTQWANGFISTESNLSTLRTIASGFAKKSNNGKERDLEVLEDSYASTAKKGGTNSDLYS
jgi:hypothetical protein